MYGWERRKKDSTNELGEGEIKDESETLFFYTKSEGVGGGRRKIEGGGKGPLAKIACFADSSSQRPPPFPLPHIASPVGGNGKSSCDVVPNHPPILLPLQS